MIVRDIRHEIFKKKACLGWLCAVHPSLTGGSSGSTSENNPDALPLLSNDRCVLEAHSAFQLKIKYPESLDSMTRYCTTGTFALLCLIGFRCHLGEQKCACCLASISMHLTACAHLLIWAWCRLTACCEWLLAVIKTWTFTSVAGSMMKKLQIDGGLQEDESRQCLCVESLPCRTGWELNCIGSVSLQERTHEPKQARRTRIGCSSYYHCKLSSGTVAARVHTQGEEWMVYCSTALFTTTMWYCADEYSIRTQ